MNWTYVGLNEDVTHVKYCLDAYSPKSADRALDLVRNEFEESFLVGNDLVLVLDPHCEYMPSGLTPAQEGAALEHIETVADTRECAERMRDGFHHAGNLNLKGFSDQCPERYGEKLRWDAMEQGHRDAVSEMWTERRPVVENLLRSL